MQKVVIDTNVVVSALLVKGYSSRIIYDLVLEKKIILCLSAEVWEEYVDVLHRDKFAKYPSFVNNAEIVLSKAEELSLNYEPAVAIDVLKDKEDNKFLELAVTSKAEYLITGNKNDFEITEYGSVKIVSPKGYWQNCKPK